MAVIHFGEKDYLQTKVVEAAIYPTEISKIEGPNKSSTGKSISYFVDFTITDGMYKGKTRTIAFNSGVNAPSILGEMQMYPVTSLLDLAKATGLDDGQVKEFNLDTDQLLHQTFDAGWAVSTNEGHLFNTISAFYPKGYGAQAPAF